MLSRFGEVSTQGHQSWTTAEIKALRLVAYLGAQGAATLFRRSVESVKQQAKRSGISLARPPLGDERRRLDADRVVELHRLLGLGVPLCPRCARAPIEVRVESGATGNGWCRACHLEELATAHNLAVVEVKADRELDAARQRKTRGLRHDRRTRAGRESSRRERSGYRRRLLRWQVEASIIDRWKLTQGHDPADPRMPPRAPASMHGQRLTGTFGTWRVNNDGLLESAQSPQDSGIVLHRPASADTRPRRSDAVSTP